MHEVISTREIRVRLVIRFTIFNLSLFADRSGIDKQKSLLKNIVLYIFERASFTNVHVEQILYALG